jgi:hypothetical protein
LFVHGVEWSISYVDECGQRLRTPNRDDEAHHPPWLASDTDLDDKDGASDRPSVDDDLDDRCFGTPDRLAS